MLSVHSTSRANRLFELDRAGRFASLTTPTTPDDVAEHVLTLLPDEVLRGEDTAYMRWYAGLLAACERLEKVPVAFSDSWEPHGWQVGLGRPGLPLPATACPG